MSYAGELLEKITPYENMNNQDLLDNQVLDRYWEISYLDSQLLIENLKLGDKSYLLIKDKKDRIFGMVPPEYEDLLLANKNNFKGKLHGGNYRLVENIPNTCKHIVETHYRDYSMDIIIST